MNKIPAITIGTGSQINVHSPLDHADRLDYKLLEQRTTYILNYLVNLANSEASDFVFTDDLLGVTGVTGGPATKTEMLTRGYEGERAFKVANIIKGSKGEKAGLLPEDLILSVNGKEMKKKPFYQGLEDALGDEYNPNTSHVQLRIARDKEVMDTILDY